MRIGRPQLQSENGILYYRAEVESGGSTQTLWYSLDTKHTGLVSDRADAALVALLLPAMRQGEDILIEGTVSEKLLFSISGPCQEVLLQLFPQFYRVAITVSDVRPALPSGGFVAAGFSGGIDSFSLLADHHYGGVSDSYRLTHLLFFNVGSHRWKKDADQQQLFQQRLAHLKPLAERLGLPLVSIDSNVDSFYDDLTFESTVIMRNVSAALLLQEGLRKFLVASSVHYKDLCVNPREMIETAGPAILPLLETEALDIVSADARYTRVEKTVRVAEITDSYTSLHVCTSNSPVINCSSCPKCLRTILTLEIAGVLDRYAAVFDLGLYRRLRNRYIEEVLSDSDPPFSQEIIAFMKERNFRIPASCHLRMRYNLSRFRKTVRRAKWRSLRLAGQAGRMLRLLPASPRTSGEKRGRP